MNRLARVLILMLAAPLYAQDVIVFPFLQPNTPQAGAYGSMWLTRLTVFNDTGVARLVGLDCAGICGARVTVAPGETRTLSFGGSGFRLTGDQANLQYRLRAFDVSRLASSLGVEIPVMRSVDFADSVQLLDLATSPGYRTSLRIYSFRGVPVGRETVTVRISIFDEDGSLWREELMDLLPFSPTPYLELHSIERDLLAGAPATVRVEVASAMEPDDFGGFPIYAFATTTNNESQEVTLTTPAR